MPQRLEDVIGEIEAANTIEALSDILHTVAKECGYSAFSFVDASHVGQTNPTVLNTIRKGFDSDYRAEGLLAVDPMIPMVRRSNRPFTWGGIPLPPRLGRRIPGAIKTMNIARDHGYVEGLVVPFHYVDDLGRPSTAVCTFFWSDSIPIFNRLAGGSRAFLHMVVIYWAQRVVELVDIRRSRAGRTRSELAINPPTLTDREREVLSWAAMGKTVQDTADILSISTDTVETHIRSAMRKLGANNKTHAVARAIFLRLIDY